MRRTLTSRVLVLGFGALSFGCATKSDFTPAGVDANGDNVADDLGNAVDVNADGIADLIDMNKDGTTEGVGVDTNGDGVADALGLDTNSDGLLDAVDVNGDGQPDRFSQTASSSQGPGTGGGTGGAPTVGGSGGTGTGGGGAIVDPVVRTLPTGWTGFVTAKVTDSVVASTYADFKTKNIESCGGGTMRVKRDSSDNNDTVSEGIGYGMLLAVGNDDQATFDGLWAFFKQQAAGNGGLMPWKMSGCSGVQDSNSATDAELDAAMALIQASCKWGGNYKTEGASLMGAIISQLKRSRNGSSTLLAGKRDFGDSCLNPSYVSPGYYRAFAAVDTANAAAWNDLAADSYTLLNSVANSSTGLVPDWSSECEGKSQNYSYDAARTPWRVATDYLWYGTPAAKTFADRVTNWVVAQGGIGSVKAGYTTSGSPTANYSDVVFSGAFATAALTHSQERADAFAPGLNNRAASNYFSRTLKGLYALLATGKFDKSCY